VVWRGGPAEPWVLSDPLEMHDLKMTLNVVFPNPGTYQIVLVANGEEVARQRFVAQYAAQMRTNAESK
jgi:hypothetical protein